MKQAIETKADSKFMGRPADRDADNAALAAQMPGDVKRREGDAADLATRRRENMGLGEENRVRAAAARKDHADDARKAHAKKTGGNLFPEVQPADGEEVLATATSRIGSTMFVAQFRLNSTESPHGAFYSDRNGSYSILEGGVESWMKLPGS